MYGDEIYLCNKARCLECADICQLCVRMQQHNSPFLKEICELCAKICEYCAEECEKHSHDHCKKCAEACRQCAEECRKIAM
ncbi:hypothetical protein ABCA12_0142 [Acinetobacter junii]|nr:hypothetical protein ABCA12_0142 [Acinetobacter junii]